ncbi:hypothetical protein ACFX1R_021759 [Malus domestica]
MADVKADVAGARIPKKRTFKKFSFRGVNLDALVDMLIDELVKLFPAIGLAEGSREICTDGRSARARAPGFAATSAPSYSSGLGVCPDGRV